MKSILRIAALASIFTLLGFCSIGCAPTVNPPTAPVVVVGTGYVDSHDQEMGQEIALARKFYTDLQNDVNQRTYVPSPTELTALNALGVAINIAESARLAYHNTQTSANLTAGQNAVSSMTSQQNALATQIPAGVK